jgi:hypothetical protein
LVARGPRKVLRGVSRGRKFLADRSWVKSPVDTRKRLGEEADWRSAGTTNNGMWWGLRLEVSIKAIDTVAAQ